MGARPNRVRRPRRPWLRPLHVTPITLGRHRKTTTNINIPMPLMPSSHVHSTSQPPQCRCRNESPFCLLLTRSHSKCRRRFAPRRLSEASRHHHHNAADMSVHAKSLVVNAPKTHSTLNCSSR